VPATHPWRQGYHRLHDRASPGESTPGHFRPRGATVSSSRPSPRGPSQGAGHAQRPSAINRRSGDISIEGRPGTFLSKLDSPLLFH
jgi:hypothetical protein